MLDTLLDVVLRLCFGSSSDNLGALAEHLYGAARGVDDVVYLNGGASGIGRYRREGLCVIDDLEALNFFIVGYGCTTCIGNSGPIIEEVSQAVNANDLAVTSVLSGNRNFEGRINPDVKMNYLASPPLVIAYALAGTMDFDFETEALGQDADGNDVFLKDIWPNPADVQSTIDTAVTQEMFTEKYADVFAGDERWTSLETPEGNTFEWADESTYVRKPPYFEGMKMDLDAVEDISGARVLAKLGDSVTTDHISPAGAIKADSPAGVYLADVRPAIDEVLGRRR